MTRLIEQVRAAVRASGQTPYVIARGSGVARSQLSRLLSGQAGMTVDTIEKLARHLRLEIIIRSKRRARRR